MSISIDSWVRRRMAGTSNGWSPRHEAGPSRHRSAYHCRGYRRHHITLALVVRHLVRASTGNARRHRAYRRLSPACKRNDRRPNGNAAGRAYRRVRGTYGNDYRPALVFVQVHFQTLTGDHNSYHGASKVGTREKGGRYRRSDGCGW